MDDPLASRLDRDRLNADICKALVDPKRLMLLDILGRGERSVGELAAVLGCALPNASQHLSVLRAAGLVETRRDGNVVRYRLAELGIVEACDAIARIVGRRLDLLAGDSRPSDQLPTPAR